MPSTGNPAYFYTPGPCAAFVKIPVVGAGPFVGPSQLFADPGPTYFLGHCDKTPKPAHEQKWKPVISSQTGEVIPADQLYMGTDLKVVLPLARFNWTVLNLLLATPRSGRATPPGTETYIDVGRLKQRNGDSFILYLVHEFYGTVNQAAYPDLPPGIAFICCNLAGTYPDNIGRDCVMAQLLIEAEWVQAAGGGGIRVAYTQDPNWFKGLPPVG